MHFANPGYFLLLFLLPAAVWLYRTRARRAEPRVTYSDVTPLLTQRRSLRAQARRTLPWFRALAAGLVIIALARPQKISSREVVHGQGIDIVLVIDLSYSMRAEDFPPGNRFEGARTVLSRFVSGIVEDRLALVVFASQAFTQCPLTLDRDMVRTMVEQLQLGMISGDSTAIGMALSTAASRLDRSQSKSKVIILLTDGENNAGSIDPVDAARACQALGIRVYTIGIGKPEGSPVPVQLPDGRAVYARRPDGSFALTKLDEELLKRIASITGGEYHHAGDTGALQAVYESIWRLEKSRFEMQGTYRRHELLGRFLWPAAILLGLELLAGATILRKAP
jgi:Ca-activated chloride channel homolog